MRDNQIIMLIRPLLLSAFAAQGLATFQVKQNFQTTQQGRVGTDPACYMTKVLDHRHGSPRIAYEWIAATPGPIVVPAFLQRTKTEILESTWQFSFTVAEVPTNDDELTAADYAKITASIMQDNPFRASIKAAGVNIERIQNVPTDNVINDRDQFEKNVHFDAIIVHKDITVTTSPYAQTIKSGIYRV